MSVQLAATHGCIRIQGDMTVYSAAELKPALLNALPVASQAERLDLSAVGDFDCAGLQLLLASLSRARSNGTPLRIVAVSTSVREVLELCQRADLLAELAP
jgi:anti-anti-sigma factor